MSKQPEQKLPGFIAYVLEENEGTWFWNRIGAAWSHKDNAGFTIKLHALPPNGRIVLRARKDGEPSERGAQ